MKLIPVKPKKAAFTIIELLTVMSIIILLIGLLVPALNMVKKYAKRVSQKHQFHAIEVGMETYNAEWEEYPESIEGLDPATGLIMCGATRLAEAMLGRDLLGYSPTGSYFIPGPPPLDADLSGRRYYLKPDGANATKLEDIYGTGGTKQFDPATYVLCDMYKTIESKGALSTGQLVGTQILYFRANTSGTTHPTTANGLRPNTDTDIYNVRDNMGLLRLGVASQPALQHPMVTENPPIKTFYDKIWNPDITTASRPRNADSYILLSAGFDGQYGTDDDVFNFGI